ncbi:MAG: ATP-binding protein [Clostridia bacterium]|nr:ATP-binding protein [Clostridia bacterium]
MIRHNPSGIYSVIQVNEITASDSDTRIVEIIIADNDPKIPEKLKDNMFNSFVVGDESINKKNGSGLRLAVSKK